MRHRARLFMVLLITGFLAGCVSTTNILDMGKNTYSISATADGMRSAASARESAFGAGKVWCTKKGKRFLLVNERAESTRMGTETTVSVTFRCLREDNPDYIRSNIRQWPDVIIEDQRK